MWDNGRRLDIISQEPYTTLRPISMQIGEIGAHVDDYQRIKFHTNRSTGTTSVIFPCKMVYATYIAQPRETADPCQNVE